jgi:hypothetical protein
MAENNYYCSLQQAYNFKKDQQETVGHLVSMTIGTQVLAADQTLTNPIGLAGVAVVGPISAFSWGGGFTDSIFIDANLTTTNQTNVSVLVNTDLTSTIVTFNFNIYKFDPVAKVYYLACTTNSTALNMYLFKRGGDLSLSVETEADQTVPSPLNYRMAFGVMPQPSAQVINLAYSNTQKIVKPIGVAVSD